MSMSSSRREIRSPTSSIEVIAIARPWKSNRSSPEAVVVASRRYFLAIAAIAAGKVRPTKDYHCSARSQRRRGARSRGERRARRSFLLGPFVSRLWHICLVFILTIKENLQSVWIKYYRPSKEEIGTRYSKIPSPQSRCRIGSALFLSVPYHV